MRHTGWTVLPLPLFRLMSSLLRRRPPRRVLPAPTHERVPAAPCAAVRRARDRARRQRVGRGRHLPARALYRKATAEVVASIGAGLPRGITAARRPTCSTASYVCADGNRPAGCGGRGRPARASHGIGLPPVVAHAARRRKRRVARLQVLSGGEKDRRAGHHRKPGGGSDVRGGVEDHRAARMATTDACTAQTDPSPGMRADSPQRRRCAPDPASSGAERRVAAAHRR